MEMLAVIRQLWQHVEWADARLRDALDADGAPREAWREYAHVLAAEEVWLARLEDRSRSVPVWPDLDRHGADELRGEVVARYRAYLDRLSAGELARRVEYVTSDGREFRTLVGEILLQVVLHGQYHRGKVNLLLRQAGLEPAPVDFVAFVRGAPAARTPV